MALPTNRIKKIKLPDNTEYDIVPTMLQDGSSNYKAILPTLSSDSKLALEIEIVDLTPLENS